MSCRIFNKSLKELKTIPSNYMIIFYLLSFLLITSCVPLIHSTPNSKIIVSSKYSKSAKHQIELFVMSQCPYAVEAEKTIVSLIQGLKDEVDFKIYFIAEENNKKGQDESFAPPPVILAEKGLEEIEEDMDQCHGEFISEGGKFKSLHGKSEVDENIRQLVMAKYYPYKYLDYLLLRGNNFSSDNWEECATKAWMDCKFISKIARSEEGEILFRENIKKAKKLKIDASPTLLINGKRYRGQINRFGLGRNICKEGPLNQFCRSIPVCGTDSDCLAEGKVGVCVDPDKPQATCKFSNPVNFKLTVIKPTDCSICRHDHIVEMMKDLFPEVELEELEKNSIEAEKLINDLNIREIPAFYFDKNITKTARYGKIKDRLSEVENGFLLDSKYLNITYVLDREEKKGETKLFVESMSPRTIATENFLIEDGFLKEANISIHYIAGKVNFQRNKDFEVLTIKRDRDNPGVLHLSPQQEKIILKSSKGLKEIQEDIRQICISKYYSEQHLNYLSCINMAIGKNKGTIDWRRCLEGEQIDYSKIDSCTNGKEGMELLMADIALIKELGISLSPTYLINNKILLKGIDPISFKKIYTELIEGKIEED